MVTLMQCIHDTVYTLQHPCYATLSLSQFLQLKKNIKKRKKQKKNVFIGSTANNKFHIRIVQQKIHNIKEEKGPFYMSLKENITESMTSLSYGRVFCLESQKIDGTEYLIRRSTDFAIFFFYIIEPRSLKLGRRI